MNEYWKSKVHGIEANSLQELVQKLNEFYEGKFIVATQTDLRFYKAIVYYKVAPDVMETLKNASNQAKESPTKPKSPQISKSTQKPENNDIDPNFESMSIFQEQKLRKLGVKDDLSKISKKQAIALIGKKIKEQENKNVR